jgi:plasmid stabilization system protein ParE
MTTVVVVDEADEQLREILDWWAAHRPAAPTLVLDEFAQCVTLLEGAPKGGAPVLRDPR